MNVDDLDRLPKALMDSGEVASAEEAYATFRRYGVRLRLGRDVENDNVAQTIALTAINAASRSFLGNVAVESDDFELSVPGFEGQRLSQFLIWARVKDAVPAAETWPRINIGSDPEPGEILPWANGWRFGIGCGVDSPAYFAPSCVAAAGLAVSEAFSILRKDNPYAGRRQVEFDLWNPLKVGVEPSPGHCEPAPGGLWLVGLGHLGQAYAWVLGFMAPCRGTILVQDVDAVSRSNLSTSMVCTVDDIRTRKSRVVARWLEARGYDVALVERRFNEHQRVGPDEPREALFGVDNPVARRACEGAGFTLVIDSGLGAGHDNFRAMRMRTFPGPSKASRIWASSGDDANKALAPAYRKLLADGAEPCGVTMLASRAVGAPFVGCVAAAFAISEWVRRRSGGVGLGYLDLNLRDPQLMDAG